MDLDSSSIYNGKSYVGGKFAIVLNNLNSELLPTSGVIWNTELSSMFGTNENSHHISKITSDLAVYASLRDPAKLVAVLRFGAGHIFNDNFEYFQALTLGANNYLRDQKKPFFWPISNVSDNRTTGKLFESKSYVPGAVGLIRKQYVYCGADYVLLNVWAVLAPAAMIALLTIGINLTGDAIARSLGRWYVPKATQTVPTA